MFLRKIILPSSKYNKCIHNASFIYLTKEMNEVKIKYNKVISENQHTINVNNELLEENKLLKGQIDRLLKEKYMNETKIFNLKQEYFYDSLK